MSITIKCLSRPRRPSPLLVPPMQEDYKRDLKELRSFTYRITPTTATTPSYSVWGTRGLPSAINKLTEDYLLFHESPASPNFHTVSPFAYIQTPLFRPRFFSSNILCGGPYYLIKPSGLAWLTLYFSTENNCD